MRVALVGYGLAGRVFHGPLVAGAGLELSVVVTGRADRQAEVRADHPGAEVLSSSAELFARPDPYDLLVIAAPGDVHASLALASIAIGKAADGTGAPRSAGRRTGCR